MSDSQPVNYIVSNEYSWVTLRNLLVPRCKQVNSFAMISNSGCFDYCNQNTGIELKANKTGMSVVEQWLKNLDDWCPKNGRWKTNRPIRRTDAQA